MKDYCPGCRSTTGGICLFHQFWYRVEKAIEWRASELSEEEEAKFYKKVHETKLL